MKIFLASDHRGFEIKAIVKKHLLSSGYIVEDDGDDKYDANDDFTIYASKAVNNLLSSDDSDAKAILVCGSGQGMVMAANRFKGIRAGLGWSVEAARGIRNDEDSNVLALPSNLASRPNGQQEILDIIDAWLKTPFAGAARYIRRNQELDQF